MKRQVSTGGSAFDNSYATNRFKSDSIYTKVARKDTAEGGKGFGNLTLSQKLSSFLHQSDDNSINCL